MTRNVARSITGDNNEPSQFFEKHKAANLSTLGMAVFDGETFDSQHIAIAAAVNVGRIFALALGAEHGKPRP